MRASATLRLGAPGPFAIARMAALPAITEKGAFEAIVAASEQVQNS
jgi:hypothetical protein